MASKRKIKICIIDESEKIFSILERMLVDYGISQNEIKYFSNISKAFDYIIYNPINIIFYNINTHTKHEDLYTYLLLKYEKSFAKHIFLVSTNNSLLTIDTIKNHGAEKFMHDPINGITFYHLKNHKLKHSLSINQNHMTNNNIHTLSDKIGINPKHIPMLIKSFNDDIDTLLPILYTAINQYNFFNIQQITHTLKINCGNMQLIDLYKACQDMEYAAKNNETNFNYADVFQNLNSSKISIGI